MCPVRLPVRSAVFQAAQVGFDSRTGYWLGSASGRGREVQEARHAERRRDTGGDCVWERTRSPKPTAESCGVRFLRHLLNTVPWASWSGRLPVTEKIGGSSPLGIVGWKRKCVRRWLGACLLSRFTWVRFPPLPLFVCVRGVAATRHSSKVGTRVRLPPDALVGGRLIHERVYGANGSMRPCHG